MKRSKVALIMFTAWIGVSVTHPAPPDDFCGIRNTAFQAGEVLTYQVYYALAGIYVNAGIASFTTTLTNFDNRPVYHISGEGNTNSSYDWIYKVRDRYESFIDTATMQPLKFIRNVNESGYKKYQNVTFNKTANTAIASEGVFKIPACVQDVVSCMYYARNVDYSHLQAGDKLPFSLFLNNEIYNMYIRYMGKEVIRTKYGKFNAIKLKPLLLKGSIFEGGELMTVWISDDANHIPVRVETPLVVGKVKIDLVEYEKLRYPLSALIKKY